MTERIELKPCPFCGKAGNWISTVCHERQWQVHCRNCGANGPMAKVVLRAEDDQKSWDEACELWNARSTP